MSRSLESVGLGLTGAIVESLSRLGGDNRERTEGLTRVSIEVEIWGTRRFLFAKIYSVFRKILEF